jgi:hypothetical protein
MKKIFKASIVSLAIAALTASSAFAATPSYDIQYTHDTVPAQTMNALSSGGSLTTIFDYDGTFKHLIYSSSVVNIKNAESVTIEGQQQSTNSSYPSLNVQYTFVDKGTKLTDPSDDVLLTGTNYGTSGDYSNPGSYTNTFTGNANAGTGKSAFLRAWNWNNQNGSSSSKTVHIWGAVKK